MREKKPGNVSRRLAERISRRRSKKFYLAERGNGDRFTSSIKLFLRSFGGLDRFKL
jgi:hypothetical protein